VWSLLDAGDDPAWERVWDGAMAGNLAGLTGELAASVALTDLDSIAATADELVLLAALVQPVETAMYWQEPDDLDQALADPAVWEALLPVARAVTAAPAARWGPAPVATGHQRYVEWLGGDHYPPALTGTAGELTAWRAATAEDELFRPGAAGGPVCRLDRSLVVGAAPVTAPGNDEIDPRHRSGRAGPGGGQARVDRRTLLARGAAARRADL
jgi:hypothetical protein